MSTLSSLRASFGMSLRAMCCSGRLPSCRIAVYFLLAVSLVASSTAQGADWFETENFRVRAPSSELARQIALRAEHLRESLASEWLGTQLEPWSQPCVVEVDPHSERLMGDTTYLLTKGEISRLRMQLHGEPQRILDILLPHEVVHTVLASHFKAPIPRWADEGAALMAEDPAERDRLWRMEGAEMRSGQVIPMKTLLNAREYPSSRDSVRSFYVQGGSVTEFLLAAGKSRFLLFIATGMDEGWDRAVAVHYGFADIAGLERAWKAWIVRDRPAITLPPAELLAAVIVNQPWAADLGPVHVESDDQRIAARSDVVANGDGAGQ